MFHSVCPALKQSQLKYKWFHYLPFRALPKMSDRRNTRSAIKDAILKGPPKEIDVITLSSDEECSDPEPNKKKSKQDSPVSSDDRNGSKNAQSDNTSNSTTATEAAEISEPGFIEYTPERLAKLDIKRNGKFLNAEEIQNTAVAGDMIEFFRLGEKISYFHYALYLGDGMVMNVEASSQMGIANVQEKYLKDVIKGSPMRVKNPDAYVMEWYGKSPKSMEEILQSARKTEKKEKVPYHFVKHNCEHYCTMWRYGVGFSRQAQDQSRIHSGRAQAEMLLNRQT